MAECPICQNEIGEDDCEWISEEEVVYPLHCEVCDWRGTITYNEEEETELLWDDRTNGDVPTDADEFEAWRKEQLEFYTV